MANFTITSSQVITELTGKAGSDSYFINGGSLVIDCDSRYGPNQSPTSGPLGNVQVSTTLGGLFKLDGSKVRLIPFTGGAGNVPAPGSQITQGVATAELLCVMSSKTGGSTYTAGMPGTGWLKVRVTAGAFAAGRLAGIDAVASSPDETGWMVVVGVEDKAFVVPRLGQMVVDGRWFSVGSTSGLRGQNLTLPHFSADNSTFYPGVEIETAPGSGIFDFWANVGVKFKGSIVSTDSRSRFVHISTNGVVTLGRGLDNANAGLLPPAGCAVRIPNIILQNCGSSRSNNSVHDTLNSRYEASFGGGGTLAHSISTGAWYWNVGQAWSMDATDLHSCDQVCISRITQAPNLDRIHVGLSTRPNFTAASALLIQQCRNGGTVGSVSGVRAEGTSNSGYAVTMQNLYGGWEVATVRAVYASDCTAVSGSLFLNTNDDLTLSKAEVVGKRLLKYACKRVTVEHLVYADNVKSTTGTLAACCAVEALNQSIDCQVLRVDNWPDAPTTGPYNGVVYANTTENLIVRGVGTKQGPFSGGGLTGSLFADGGNNTKPKFQRCWLTGLRSGLNQGNASTTGLVMENCYHTDASKTQTVSQSEATSRGNRHNSGTLSTNYTGTTGTAFMDAFTGDTTARVSLVMTEPLTSDGVMQVMAGAPKFSGTGAIVMQKGDIATWTMPYFVLGWTNLTSMGVNGVNLTLHSVSYDIDKGVGFSGIFRTLSNTNLAAEGGLDPAIGFKLRVKVECTASNYSNALSNITVTGVTSVTLQNAALYPMDVPMATMHIEGLKFGSNITVTLDGEQVFAGACVTATADLTYRHRPGATNCTVIVSKPGYHEEVLTLINAQRIAIPVCQQELGAPVVVGGPSSEASDIAAAVQAILLDDFAALDARLSNQMHDAYDPNQEWFVITKDGQHLLGVTTQNPYVMGLPEGTGIAEFTGQIPDLNFSTWDFGADMFRSSLTPRLNFMSRFTIAELTLMRASTDPVVKDILERFDAKSYVNLQEQLTIDSVNHLASSGLIAPERAYEILA